MFPPLSEVKRKLKSPEAQNLRVFLCLLQPVAGLRVECLCLHHRDRIIPPVPQQVIQTLLRQALHLASRHHDPTVRKALLLAYLLVRPPRRIELGQDVTAASVRFGEERH